MCTEGYSRITGPRKKYLSICTVIGTCLEQGNGSTRSIIKCSKCWLGAGIRHSGRLKWLVCQVWRVLTNVETKEKQKEMPPQPVICFPDPRVPRLIMSHHKQFLKNTQKGNNTKLNWASVDQCFISVICHFTLAGLTLQQLQNQYKHSKPITLPLGKSQMSPQYVTTVAQREAKQSTQTKCSKGQNQNLFIQGIRNKLMEQYSSSVS